MTKRKVEEWTVERLNKERDNISFPEYQREKSLWTTEKKALLIDSILQDIDIPKLYFNRLKDKTIEVIDGQQRIWSIWEFLDDEYPYKVDGKAELFSNLTAGQKDRIKEYPLQITVFDQAEDDYLRDLFVRLQWGLLLNTGEKLHAATGKMKQFIFGNFVNHSFIKNLGIPQRRYARQTLCAQIAINFFSREKLNSFARTRYEDLLHFFNEYEHPLGKDLQLFDKAIKEILAVADRLWKMFGRETKILKSRSYILSVFLFFHDLLNNNGFSQAEEKRFADFVFRLMKRVRDESKLGIDRKNRELYSFDTMLSSAPGEKYQIERRNEKLHEYYEHFKKTGKIKGD
jgi:uncharacterized protein DUF262